MIQQNEKSTQKINEKFSTHTDRFANLYVA